MTDTADRPADDDTDFWLSVPGFRESLIEAEADYAAGRTFSEEEIRTKFGGYRRARRTGLNRPVRKPSILKLGLNESTILRLARSLSAKAAWAIDDHIWSLIGILGSQRRSPDRRTSP